MTKKTRESGLENSIFDLNGKVALVTGASKGIGLAMGKALALAGAKVVLSSRNQDTLDAVAQELRGEGLEVSGMAANMGQLDGLPKLLEDVTNTYGSLDILINNAATNPVFGPVLQSDETVFDQIMKVNVKGPWLLSKLAHPHMVARGGGSIINISSIGGVSPETYLGLYNVSKSALISMTKVFAKEWGKDGIRVNAVCPGLIKTKFSRALWEDEKIAAGFVKRLPLPRIGVPEDLMGIALWLASDAGAYATGGVFMVDGGHTI